MKQDRIFFLFDIETERFELKFETNFKAKFKEFNFWQIFKSREKYMSSYGSDNFYPTFNKKTNVVKDVNTSVPRSVESQYYFRSLYN